MGVKRSDQDFHVVLEKVGDQPLMTIKILMQITGLGLSDAKNMVDHAPVTAITGLGREKALKLKEQLEALGNVVSVPGIEVAITEQPVRKNTDIKTPAKKVKIAEESMPSDFEKALAKVYEIVGKDGFTNGDRVCNMLGDLVPKLEKERRRVKLAYRSNAVAVLINEPDQTFAIHEAVKRMMDYSDIAENVARATVLSIYRVLR